MNSSLSLLRTNDVADRRFKIEAHFAITDKAPKSSAYTMVLIRFRSFHCRKMSFLNLNKPDFRFMGFTRNRL